MPPFTDLLALLGIDLVLCAGFLRLLGSRRSSTLGARWGAAACLALLWLPMGAAHLPLLAYVRGISADLSITLVALAVLVLGQRLLGWPTPARHETLALHGAVVAGALLLYPLALGWGDWDPYRTGWGAPGLWAVLLALSLLCWVRGLRLLPTLVGLALLAWSLGLMESGNLWDYLVDPWLALGAVFRVLQEAARQAVARLRPSGAAMT